MEKIITDSLSKVLDVKREYIILSDIPDEFRRDLIYFIPDHKLIMDLNQQIIIKKTLYQQWLRKLKTKGIEYKALPQANQ